MAAANYPQLPLGVRLREQATFDNYLPGPNLALVRLLQDEITTERERFVYLWGAGGTGKTHLLQALCHRAAQRGEAAIYLPLRDTGLFKSRPIAAPNDPLPAGEQWEDGISVATPCACSTEALEGLEQLALVAIDDLDAIAGQATWGTALFHLHNRVREQGGRLLMAGLRAPAALGIMLADLRSRIAGGLVLQLQALNDHDKAEALRLQARQRGMSMPEEVALYLLRRCPRNMNALFTLLETLDQASLAAQRKLTVPFVREVLDLKV